MKKVRAGQRIVNSYFNHQPDRKISPTTQEWLYGKRRKKNWCGWNVNFSALKSYRVRWRHSIDHFLSVTIQIVLICGYRWIGVWFYQLWQVAKRKRSWRSWTELQVWFGTWGVGETGCGHGEEEIIRQRLNRLIRSINFF